MHAQVDLGDINGWSALYVAAMKQHLGVLQYLLEQGADPNVKDIMGMCPLIKASSLGYTRVVKTLLEGGAHVDMLDNQNSSALYMASLRGFIEIVDMLLVHGAQVNLENEGNHSALGSACYAGHTEVARSLLKHSAKDVRLIALLIAVLMDRHEIVQLFIESGGRAHPSAVKLARYLRCNRNALLQLCITKANEAILVAPFNADNAEEEMEQNEVMEMQKIILETVNDLHFQSMTSFGGGTDEFPTTGKDSLKLGIILWELMSLYLAADWQSIGALLDLPPIQLQAIRHDNSKAINCMREMLDVWLKTAEPPPTWERLVEAVEILDEAKAKHLRSMQV